MEDILFDTEIKLEIDGDTTYNKKVVVYNDNFNTFDHVIDMLIKYCEMDYLTALGHTLNIHNNGKSIVYSSKDEYKMDFVKFSLLANGLRAKLE